MRRKLSRLGISLMSLLCMCFLVLAINVFAADETHTTDCERFIQAYKYDDAISYINDGKEDTYPIKEGFLFAGWYTDETCENEYWGQEKPGEEVYALFLPSHVLSVKAQVSANLLNDGTSDDASASIRLVTSIDTLLYKEAGFEISYTNGETTKNVTKSSNMVYERLHAVKVGTDSVGSAIYEENGKEYTPQDAFCNLSTYFKACTVKNVPAAGYITQFTVKPFWYTVDGSKVYGETATKSISEYFAMEDVYVSTTGADTLKNGTEENPFATLEYALGMVADGGTIHIVDSYTATDAFVWKEHGKSVTISGGMIDFTALPVVVSETEPKVNASMLHIGDSVTFENIKLQFAKGAHVFAQGHTLEITENVSFSEKITLCGGAYLKPITGNTNLILKSGEYTTIYGGGFGGKVTGNTYITLSGTVNETADYTSHESNANKGARKLFGGGYGAPITGNTNIKVQSSAVEFNYIFGGGHYNAVNGDTHIEYAGSAMALFGGGLSGTVTGNTYITMTDGWAHQIFGGCHSREMTGSANIDVQGGTVERRVYGGCYNEEGDNGWSNYWVNGHATVKISKDATLGLNSWRRDNSLVSFSRRNVASETEKGVFLFADYENNDYVDRIGPDDSAQDAGVIEQSYNYRVKAEANGTVSADGNYLIIKPNEGLAAKVIIDKNVVHYAENETAYKLPALDSSIEKKEILIEFDIPDTSIDTTKHEAKIGASYYESLEEAVNAAEVLSTENKNVVVTLLDNVEVESTMSIDENANVTVESDEGKQYTINRATALVDTDGEIFTVSDGNTLTVNNIVLDGRTALGVGSENEDHNATLIYSAGTVNVANVTAQYATGAAIQTKGANAVTNLDTVTITNPGGNGFVATSGTTIAKKVEISETGAAGINVGSAAIVYLDTVTLNTIGSTTDHHGIYNDGGIIKTVENAEEAITIQNVVGHAVANVNAGTIILKGVTVQEVPGTNRDGIHSTGGIVTVIDATIEDIARDAIRIGGGTATVKDTNIRKSENTNSCVYGVYASSSAVTINIDNTVIESPQANGIRSAGATFDLDNVTLRNIGTTTDHHGIYMAGGTINITADNNGNGITIENAKGYGVANTSSGTVNAEHVNITGSGRSGILANGAVTNVEAGTITTSGEIGLEVRNGTVTATNMTISDSTTAGVKVNSGKSVTLGDVTITGGKDGIENAGGTVVKTDTAEVAATIQTVTQYGINNTSGTATNKNIVIEDSGSHGIQIPEGVTVKLDTITITRPGNYGINNASGNLGTETEPIKNITINNSTNRSIYNLTGKLYGDTIYINSAGHRGVDIKTNSEVEITGLYINGAVQQGVSIDLSSVAAITNFEIKNTTAASVRIAESGNILLKDGTIDEATGYSVHIDNNNTNIVTLEGVTITNSGTYGLANVDKGPVVAKNVTITSSGSAGIQLGKDSTITTNAVTISGGTQGIEANGGTLAKVEDAETGVTISDVTEYGIYNKSNTSTVQDVKISSGENGIGCEAGTLNAKNIDVKVTTSGIHMIDGTVKTDAVAITGGTRGITGVAGTVENAVAGAYGVTISGATRGISTESGIFTVKGASISGGSLGIMNEGGTISVENTEIKKSTSNGIKNSSGTLYLDNVAVKDIGTTKDHHGVYIVAGSVNVTSNNDTTNGLSLDNIKGFGIVITGGTLTASVVNVNNVQNSRQGISVTNATVEIGQATITNVGAKDVRVKKGSIKIGTVTLVDTANTAWIEQEISYFSGN